MAEEKGSFYAVLIVCAVAVVAIITMIIANSSSGSTDSDSDDITGQAFGVSKVKIGADGWTNWLDRDTPGSSGDYEPIANMVGLCPRPTAIECQAINVRLDSPGIDYRLTGQNILYCDTNYGFACQNAANLPNGCFDYKVRFKCAGSTNTTQNTTTYNCTDSDGGANYETFGSTQECAFTSSGGGCSAVPDSCSGNTLNEHYCSGNRRQTTTYTCQGTCSNGACVAAINQTNTTSYTCSDSDGTNIWTYGYVTGINGTSNYTSYDFCSGNYAVEQHCSGNAPATFTSLCPQSCSGGRCVNTTNTTTTCSDTDGTDIWTYGYGTGANGTIYYDSCAGNYVSEQYCSGNNLKNFWSLCPQTCNGGMCVNATQNTTTNGTINTTGYLTVTTNPTGANVYVDNGYVGLSPLYSMSYEKGMHTIRVWKTGYLSNTTTVNIVAGQTQSVMMDMARNNTCYDSDGGDNENVTGYVTGYNYGSPYMYNDACNFGNASVSEQYCTGGYHAAVNITCRVGINRTGMCVGGSCQ